MFFRLCVLTIMLAAGTGLQAKDVVITEYGAKASTKKVCTSSIQKAIDACSKSGGGRVIIPKGKFLTGAIVLKNGVTLHLENGATLLGSKNPADYVLGKGRPGVFITSQLIFAAQAKNIGISGSGTIDGQGKGFTDRACNALGITRPMLIRFDTCKGIRINGVTLRNSGVWMQLHYLCEDLVIENVNIFNHCNNCNDGLDLNGCSNVTIRNVTVDSDDDGICLKNITLTPSKNIKVTNCTISSHCNAMKIGTETLGDISNVIFTHCTVKPSKQKKVMNGRRNGISAISVESVDGTKLDNVTFDDITVDGTEAPIFIRLGSRGQTYGQKVTGKKKGQISGVSISNVTVTNAGNTGCSITGIPGQMVENVKLSNISITHAGGMQQVKAPTDEKANAYPEGTMFGTLPSKGFFVKNARNVTFDNVKVYSRKVDDRPAVYRENVR